MKRDFLQNLKVGDQPLSKEVIDAIMAENGKDIEAAKKPYGDYDELKEQLKTAQETIRGFESQDIEGIRRAAQEWESKYEQAEKDYAAKLEARDFEDALKTAMEGYKFSSEAAKKSVMAEIRDAGLKLREGKIMGLNDFIETIRSRDASAFVTEREENRARFTEPKPAGGSGGAALTAQDIIKIKNPTERQRLIEANPHLFDKKGR